MNDNEVMIKDEVNQGDLLLNADLSFDTKMDIATEVANSLSNVIREQKLYTDIQGNPHVNIEGWRALGIPFGLHAELEGEVEPFDLGYETFDITYKAGFKEKTKTISVIAFKATTVIKNASGDVLARQSAICSNTEKNKREHEAFSIYSMAETRSEGRAWREILGWIMGLAGFKTTPVEEMEYDKSKGTVEHTNTPKIEPLGKDEKEETQESEKETQKEPENVQEAEFNEKPIIDTTHEDYLKNIKNDIEEKKSADGKPLFKATLPRIKKRASVMVENGELDEEMYGRVLGLAEDTITS